MKKLKRIASLLLCAAMLFSMIPAASAVNYSSWFKSSYLEMQNLGLVPASFLNLDLTKNITRQEMCQLAIQALEKITGNKITPERSDYFTDTKEVTTLKAYERGIVSGYADGTFRPSNGIKRQEFFQILLNSCHAASFQPTSDYSYIKKFSDRAYLAAWAVDAAQVCVKYGYVTGREVDGQTLLAPGALVSRQEAMAMFLRCYKGMNEYYYYVKNAKVVANNTNATSIVGGVTITNTTKTMIVNTSSLNVRSAPDASAAKLGALAYGTNVTVTGVCSNGWLRIAYDNTNAYVSGSYLKDASGSGTQTPIVVPATVAGSKAVAVANEALTFVGYSYVYGGKSPSGGFDCSGLVYYVFTRNGYVMSRVADDQMNQGTPVAMENLLAGDLVFFGYGDYANHVGIYIGNGNFVHAANPSSGVRVSALNETYYAKRYLGARRIIAS